MKELCDCGKEEATIQTTNDGKMCELCFNEKYGIKYPQKYIAKFIENGKN